MEDEVEDIFIISLELLENSQSNLPFFRISFHDSIAR